MIRLRHDPSTAIHVTMFAVSLGVFAALCWSGHDCVARFYAERIGPFRMAFWVALTGALILLPMVMWRGTILQADAVGLGYAIALGGAYAVALAGLFVAFSIAPVSIVAPMTAGFPVLVVIWGLINGLTPSSLEWAAVLLVVVGAVIVGSNSQPGAGPSSIAPGKLLKAMTAIAAANVAFATAVILGQKAALSLGDFETTFVSRFPAALLLAPLFLREKKTGAAMDRNMVIAVLAMATLDVAAITVINYSGQFPNRALAAMGISAYGALGVLLAMVFLHEKVRPGQWLGIVLVVCGIAALGWPK